MDVATSNGIRLLAELAGVRLPEEREVALGAGLEVTRRIAGALAQHDYGVTSPACSFRAPPSER